MRKVVIIAAAILVASLGLSAPARCLSITDLLSKAEGDQGFKLIHVADLAAMMVKPDSKVMVYDANPPDVRETEGVIPGAHMLPSSHGYDVATELPPDKNTPLVFYCHNTL
jgi:rhodanese-related sulfurtransferase